MVSPSSALAKIDRRLAAEREECEFKSKINEIYDYIMKTKQTYKAEADVNLNKKAEYIDAPVLVSIVDKNATNLSNYTSLLGRLEDKLDHLDSDGTSKSAKEGVEVPKNPGIVGELFDQANWFSYNNERLDKLLSRLYNVVG